MSNNAFFVIAIEGLQIKEDLGRGDKIAADLFISNDLSIIDQSTTPNIFREMIGNLEYNWMATCGTIIYGFFSLNYGDKENHQPFIIYNMRKIQNFLDALWLYHDNSVRFNLGFVEVRKDGQIPIFSSSNLDLYYYNSRGETEQLIISRDELKAIRLKRRELWGEFPDFSIWMGEGLNNYVNYMNNTMRSKGYSRILRSFYFINAARAAALPPIKITQYSICFECLFSSDQEELSHKVSERVAFFLESKGIPNRQVYDDVRAAYKVRSAIVHGDVLPRKITDLGSLAQKCDEYLRMAINKITESPDLVELFEEKDNQELSEYLLSLYLPPK